MENVLHMYKYARAVCCLGQIIIHFTDFMHYELFIGHSCLVNFSYMNHDDTRTDVTFNACHLRFNEENRLINTGGRYSIKPIRSYNHRPVYLFIIFLSHEIINVHMYLHIFYTISAGIN